MKTKRSGFLKGMLSAVFMLALIVTMVAVMPMMVSATNVSEIVYASNLVDGDDIVLIGNTTLPIAITTASAILVNIRWTTPNTPDNPNNTPDNPNNTPDDPSDDKDGLGAGAIVGIVVGSVAIVGIGGFALFWFFIKKKSFVDLIAVFKKK